MHEPKVGTLHNQVTWSAII